MTVTKQQQLEWLAKNLDEWKCGFIDIGMSVGILGRVSSFVPHHTITRQEWQKERDKMQKQAAQSAQPSPDNSWHERGELPPVGCECEYNDAAWGFEDVSVTPIDGDKLTICAKSKTPSGRECVIFTWVSKNGALLAAAATSPAVFRPLRPEREKAIDAACAAVCKAGPYNHERELIGKLYDAGLLK